MRSRLFGVWLHELRTPKLAVNEHARDVGVGARSGERVVHAREQALSFGGAAFPLRVADPYTHAFAGGGDVDTRDRRFRHRGTSDPASSQTRESCPDRYGRGPGRGYGLSCLPKRLQMELDRSCDERPNFSFGIAGGDDSW